MPPSTDKTHRPSGLRPAALVGIYLGIALSPLIVALWQGLSANHPLREFSSGLVMVGFAITFAQFVLSGRFRSVSGKVGIDLVMRFHQIAAWTAFAFILAHPFLYAVPRLALGPAEALNTLGLMFSSTELRSGVIALALLVLLVPLAAWRDRLFWSYEAWRLGHGLGAAAIAILGAHHAINIGTHSAQSGVTSVWILLLGLGLFSLLYVYVITPIRQYRNPYRVASVKRAAHRLWEVTVEPVRGPALEFAPGQFVWLNLGHSPFSLIEHPFSISSAPADRPRLAFIIKESGDFTNRIGALPVGSRAYLDGPHGNFTLVGRQARGIALIAGGVGIAPLLSILWQLATERCPYPVRLIYGNRIEPQILCRAELQDLTRTLDLRVHFVLSEPPAEWAGKTGGLTPDVLRECLDVPASADWLYFICGPPAMMSSAERTLLALGVPLRQLVTEQFRYDYALPSRRQTALARLAAVLTLVFVLAALLFALR
jgi:predicted ferric reductase